MDAFADVSDNRASFSAFFYGLRVNTPESCDDSTFAIPICCIEREMHVFKKVSPPSRNINYFVFLLFMS